MAATFSVTSSSVQVVICQHVKMCRDVKVLFEFPTFAVNYEDQQDIRHLSADNAPASPCDYGECPFVN